ncbi:MAG: universal stress protein [Hyphomicrobiaceae bacterium]|nr:universal stress protein [Hyphomicrobiaceae bacterium]
MYSHILAATDGSPFALEAARHALALAKSLDGRLTAVIVTPTWRAIALSEIAVGNLEEQFDQHMQAHADACLAPIREHAERLGVPCETVRLTGDQPYVSILRSAQERGCHLIVAGSHGRRGAERLLLGSETSKLLAHSMLPVLVYRR